MMQKFNWVKHPLENSWYAGSAGYWVYERPDGTAEVRKRDCVRTMTQDSPARAKRCAEYLHSTKKLAAQIRELIHSLTLEEKNEQH